MARKKEDNKEHKTPWQETYAGVQEIQDFLRGRIMLRRNALTGLVESRWPAEFPGETTEWESLSSVTVNTLWSELSLEKQVRKQDMQNVIESDFVGEYHPFRQYLEHLPPWDGVSDHILAMSMSVQVKGGAEEQLLFAQYLKKWLVWMVAAWVDPQVVNNVILVLLGFRFRTVRGYRHYQVVRRSADEMRVMRHRLPGGDGDGGDDS